MEVPITSADLRTVIEQQSTAITNLNISIAAYIRTIATLEAEIAELKAAEEDKGKDE